MLLIDYFLKFCNCNDLNVHKRFLNLLQAQGRFLFFSITKVTGRLTYVRVVVFKT